MAFASLLGFAQKAGRLVSGSTAVERALQSGKVHLLVVAADASDRLVRRVEKASCSANVPVVKWGTKTGLGQAVGKRDLGVLAVCDRGFANALKKQVQE